MVRMVQSRDIIYLCVCDKKGNHEVQGEAAVISIWTGVFRDIPARLIEKEHEVRSRQYSGLLESMRFAYDGFSEYETVTALGYLRL